MWNYEVLVRRCEVRRNQGNRAAGISRTEGNHHNAEAARQRARRAAHVQLYLYARRNRTV